MAALSLLIRAKRTTTKQRSPGGLRPSRGNGKLSPFCHPERSASEVEGSVTLWRFFVIPRLRILRFAQNDSPGGQSSCPAIHLFGCLSSASFSAGLPVRTGKSKRALSFGRLNEGSPEGGEIRNLPPLPGRVFASFLHGQKEWPPAG